MASDSRYYQAQQRRLLKKHDTFIRIGTPCLRSRSSEDVTTAIIQETRIEFEGLIPVIPYIGGRTNPFTSTMIQTASAIALYRVLQRRGESVEQIGALVIEIAARSIYRYPRVIRSLLGRLYLSRFGRRRVGKHAQRSQARHYASDFVYDVVEGRGTPFVWGINYRECGIVKFCHAQGADELVPYLCQIDDLLFPALGIRLQRQGTIALGCSQCDFRFYPVARMA